MNVRDFLSDKNVPFTWLPHQQTFDAQHLAQVLHTPGREVAKTVLLRADSAYAYIVAVLPATKSVDLVRLSEALGGANLEVASEAEVQQHCPDCELGSLPPFGAQYGIRTVVDESLTDDEEIVFEGNTHSEAIRMRFDDYQRIEEPLIADFAM